MTRIGRRRFLAVGGVACAVGLAGCGFDEEGELVVSNTQVHYQDGDRRYQYPQDVGARITIENTLTETQTVTLEATLEREESEGSWVAVATTTQTVEVLAATSRIPFVVFESVADSDDEARDFRIEAELME
jgi:hypothetical protein